MKNEANATQKDRTPRYKKKWGDFTISLEQRTDADGCDIALLNNKKQKEVSVYLKPDDLNNIECILHVMVRMFAKIDSL
jgi:hypothetical protein